jgi:hypothetical protein
MKKRIASQYDSSIKHMSLYGVAVKSSILFVLSINALSLSANEYTDLSKLFLEHLVQEKEAEVIVQKYAELSLEDLVNGLETREEKLTFWINTYNAFIIYILQKDRSKYDNRGAFFSGKQINIAGLSLSFDNIEHDIIRNSRLKWSLGYLKKWFVSKDIRQLRISKREPLIHFALNCGAMSCPPVDIYDEQTIASQLNTNSRKYLVEVTDISKNRIETTPLFSWFRGDFGGKKGVKKLLKSFGLIDRINKMELSFKGYDWTIDIDNYVPGLK